MFDWATGCRATDSEFDLRTEHSLSDPQIVASYIIPYIVKNSITALPFKYQNQNTNHRNPIVPIPHRIASLRSRSAPTHPHISDPRTSATVISLIQTVSHYEGVTRRIAHIVH